MATTLATILQRLDGRRRSLGMTFPDLSLRSGVPEPSIKRILSGRVTDASFANVEAIAQGLGVSLQLNETDPDKFRRQQARKKAETVVRLVQGTSALESQAVDGRTIERLLERTYRDLLAGSPRRLWSP